MNVSIKEKRTEAVKRMRAMRMYKRMIRQFEVGKEHPVCFSEGSLAGCYWVNDDMKKTIKAFEEKYNALVYHVIRHNSEFGIMNVMLYVSDHPEEWSMDWDDLRCQEPYAFVINEGAGEQISYGDIGRVGIRVGLAGGLLRTA